MRCHRMGLPPISIIGLGRISVSSERRVPKPPAKITTFTASSSRVWRVKNVRTISVAPTRRLKERVGSWGTNPTHGRGICVRGPLSHPGEERLIGAKGNVYLRFLFFPDQREKKCLAGG